MSLPVISSSAATLVLLTSIPSIQASPSSSRPQTPNLRWILLQRCYSNSPAKEHDTKPKSCDSLVADLMDVFQSKDDEDISTSDYDSYLSSAAFSTEPDSALFWPEVDDEDHQSFGALVRPEGTPGGALLAGLSFCGADKAQSGCPFGDFYEQSDSWTGAQASFWSGAYSAFASGVSGKIQVVTLEKDEEDLPGKLGKDSLFLTSALPLLDADKITAAEIYLVGATGSEAGDASAPDGGATCDTSSSVLEITAALEAHGIQRVTCMGDPSLLYAYEPKGTYQVVPKSELVKKRHPGNLVAFFAIALWIMAGFFMVRSVNRWEAYEMIADVEQSKQESVVDV